MQSPMVALKLYTDRLILRSIHTDDSEAIYSYRSDAKVNKYQGWIPERIEDVYEFIQNRVEAKINIPETWHQLVVIEKSSNRIIGDIGLHFLDKEKKQVELGFTLDKNFQRKGFANEAIQEVIRYLFTELNKHRIITSIDPDNLPSIKLVERLGFRKEAYHIKSIFMNGKWVDDIIYALLKEEI